MQFETIEVAVDGERGSLTLNRPEKLNPLSVETLGEIEAAARWFDTHPDLKVVVVSGRGRAFCAGFDLVSFGSVDTEHPRAAADAGWRMGRALEEMQAVIVARIQGWCVGGGLVLAAGCDLRVVADDARFSIPEVELGIPLAWGGIPRLVREIGPARTKELVMTCREFGPAEAHAAGFVNSVVPAAGLDAAVDELVATLVRMPKLALVATKVHTNAVTESMVGAGRSWSDADVLSSALADPECREAGVRYLSRKRGQ